MVLGAMANTPNLWRQENQQGVVSVWTILSPEPGTRGTETHWFQAYAERMAISGQGDPRFARIIKGLVSKKY